MFITYVVVSRRGLSNFDVVRHRKFGGELVEMILLD